MGLIRIKKLKNTHPHNSIGEKNQNLKNQKFKKEKPPCINPVLTLFKYYT